VVERIDVARPSFHAEEEHAPRPRREVRRPRRQRVGTGAIRPGRLLVRQGGERQVPEPRAGRLQPGTAREHRTTPRGRFFPPSPPKRGRGGKERRSLAILKLRTGEERLAKGAPRLALLPRGGDALLRELGPVPLEERRGTGLFPGCGRAAVEPD